MPKSGLKVSSGFSYFEPMDFLVTTSISIIEEEFLPTDKRVQSGLWDVDLKTQARFIKKQLENGTEDEKIAFLMDFTREAHERRHFFDIVSTTVGRNFFIANWNSIRFFYNLLDVLASTDESLKIPIQNWVDHRSCPPYAKTFLEQYQINKKYLNAYSLGEGWEKPADEFPMYVKDDLFGMRVEEKEGYRPYLGIHTGTKVIAFPIKILDLFEAAAWNQQLITMNQIGGETALKIWQNFREQSPKKHFPLLLAAFFACKAVREDMSKMFEFAFLAPLTIEGRLDKNPDPMQYDPSWRFYALWQYMIQNRSLNLENAIKGLCQDKKWIQPCEVISDARKLLKSWKEEVKSGLILEPDNNLVLVLDDYLKFFDRITAARKETCLFEGPDDKKLIKLMRSNEPPLHRVIRNDRKMFFWANPAVHEGAWHTFFELSHIMRDAVGSESISCPYRVKVRVKPPPPGILPGDGRCTCELERDQCHIAGFFEKLGVKVERLCS